MVLIGKIFIILIYFYFKKVIDVKDLLDGVMIVVLNDVFNEFWVFFLFKNVGLIILKISVGFLVMVKDI